MDIPHNALVAVADGEKMLFLRNEGDEKYPNLTVERKRTQENPPDREIGTDTAGRNFQSGSHMSMRSGYDETDFHQLAEDRFASETVDLLKKRAFNNDYDALIIAAPPKALGEMRKHYHVEIENRLIGEVDKELTGHEISDIEKILQDA